MKKITDEFKALDAVEYGKKEGYTYKVTANTITAKGKFMPKMNLFQIRTKGFSDDTMATLRSYINDKSAVTKAIFKIDVSGGF